MIELIKINEGVSFNEVRREVNSANSRISSGNVTVLELGNEDTKVGSFGVNWSSIGQVDINKAEQFMKDLQTAIDMAKDLNNRYAGKEYDD